MPTLPARRAPLWFHLLVAAAASAIGWTLAPPALPPLAGGGDVHAPMLALFAFLVALAEIVWKGLEVATKITVQFLAYSLGLLWKFANLIADGAHQIAEWTWTGLRKGWSLLRTTYSKVLKPGWEKVWKWIDRAEKWLDDTFGPVLKWLRRLRKWVLDFYALYVRPILDLMDITRRALRVLASLGVEWAGALDRRLADLEGRIERPFRLLLAKLNEVINVVNRVITADGLFQRLAFIKSLARDYREAWMQLMWGYSRAPDAVAQRALLARAQPKTYQQIRDDVADYIRTGGGADAVWLDAAKAETQKLYAVK